MNTLDPLFDWLIATTLRASVLALVILGIQAMLRPWLPARWRHALWLPMLLVLVLPILPSVPFGIFPGTVNPAIIGVEDPAPSEPSAAAVVAKPSTTIAAPQSLEPRLNLFAIGWLAGACVVLGAGVMGYRVNLERITRQAVTTDGALLQSIAQATREAGLGRVPKVIVSPGVESPAVTGFLRPLLLLPAGFPAGFSRAEARLILLHELTHLKRRDLAVNWTICVLQAMHWFNPILWFAFARMREDREAACDAQVLSLDTADHRSDYGNALLKLQSSAPPRMLSLGFVGIFERGSELRSRIREISRHRKAHPAWRAGGVVMIGTLTLFGATKAQDQKPAPAAPLKQPMDPRQAAIEAKLDKIIIPMVALEGTTLEEAIDFVHLRSVELDPEPDRAKKGVNFVIRKARRAGAVADPGEARVTMQLKDANLRTILTELAKSSGTKFKVDPWAITFTPANEKDDPPPAPKPEKPGLAGKAVEAGNKIIIPTVDFEDVSLKDAVEFLNARAKELAKGQPVFPVVLDPKANAEARIKELRLANVPLTVAVNYCAEATRSVVTANDAEIRIKRP